MKKIVMIHTSPVSLNDLKALVKQYMPDVELVNIIDDSLLEEVKKNNGPTPQIISRMNMYVSGRKFITSRFDFQSMFKCG
ncbi:MAG: hypothetical protein ACLTTH_08325 [Holdemanella porci]